MKLSTKEIIADSFRQIARRKKINSITIREIMNNCSLSIPTFYRHFKDKYDLIAWNYSRDVERVMSRLIEENHPWKKSLLDGTKYYWENQKLLLNLFLHTSGQDSFIHFMIDTNIRALQKYIQVDLSIEELNLVKIYCYGTVLFICDWLQQKDPPPPEKIAPILENALPNSLKKYLM